MKLMRFPLSCGSLFFILFLLAAAAPAFSEGEESAEREESAEGEDTAKPLLAVLPPASPTGDARYNSVGQTIADTLSLNLRLLGEYRIYQPEAYPPEVLSSPEAMGEYVKGKGYDTAVYGTIEPADTGGIDIAVQVYDRGQGESIAQFRVNSPGFLSIFDRTDTLLTSLLEIFSDRYIAYGQIALTNRGEPGVYQVFLNGEALGKNLTGMSQVLTGEYDLRITQWRFGRETVLKEGTIQVEQGTAAEAEFAVPPLSDRERETILRRERLFWAAYSRSVREARSLLEELLTLTEEGAAVCPANQRIHERYAALAAGMSGAAGARAGTGTGTGGRSAGLSRSALPGTVAFRTTPPLLQQENLDILLRGELPDSPGGDFLSFYGEIQTGGGLLGAAGGSLSLGGDLFYLSALVGGTAAGSAALDFRQTLGEISPASVLRTGLRFSLGPMVLSLSAVSTQAWSPEGFALNAGPSVGLGWKMGTRTVVFLENTFFADLIPFQGNYLTYAPSLGVRL